MAASTEEDFLVALRQIEALHEILRPQCMQINHGQKQSVIEKHLSAVLCELCLQCPRESAYCFFLTELRPFPGLHLGRGKCRLSATTV